MGKKKKRKLNYKRLLILVVVLVFCGIGIFVGGQKLFSSKKKQQPVKVVDHLEEYGYTLNDNETSYYKDLFQSLKEELNKDSVDEEVYARLISQLFCADFFNLDNKITNSDIGGTQFVYEDYQEDFEKYAKSTMYHSIESNIYGDRKQELPVVSNVEVVNLETGGFDYLEETDDNAYFLDLKITYQEDLGYQEDVSLVLVHVDQKLEIVEME